MEQSAVTDLDAESAVAAASYELVVGRAITPISEPAPGDETLRNECGEVFAAIRTSGHERIMRMPGVASFTSSPGCARVTAEAEPGVSNAAVTRTFHKSVVPLLLYWAGHEVLHASAVGSAKGVVGFCAEGGTGKSTLAYGLSTRGFPFWADDALALDVRQQPRALLLPFDPGLRPRSARFFEASSSLPAPPADGTSAPVAALALFKRVATGDNVVQIGQLTGGRAFDEVIRHAYRLGLRSDHERRRTLVGNYMKIVASVPVFEIAFRPGFSRFAPVLQAIAEWLDAEFSQAT
jgi:hypothetical protein